MKTLAKAKQKHKNLAEFIVSLDEDGKIVFLEYDKFCSKQKMLDSSKKYRVVPCLQILLEQNLITPAQIPDILTIIETHFSIMMKDIWDFVQGVDEVGRIILLPRKEFYEKFGNVKDRSELELIIIKIKSSLFSDNLISKKYITEQWRTIELFWDYFDDRLKFIETRNQIEWEMKIKQYIRSDAPLMDKINYLVELQTDFKGSASNIDLSYLETLIHELEIKQKFEAISNAKNEKKNKPIQKHGIILDEFPEIFKPKGYKLFCLLYDKYAKDNKTIKTRFSNIYHFLEYNEKLNCTQEEYIGFIKLKYKTNLSKILPKTLKYKDKIQSLLQRYSTGHI